MMWGLTRKEEKYLVDLIEMHLINISPIKYSELPKPKRLAVNLHHKGYLIVVGQYPISKSETNPIYDLNPVVDSDDLVEEIHFKHLNKRNGRGPYQKEESTMENSQSSGVLINALYDNLKCYQVRFKNDCGGLSVKEYSYKTFIDLAVDDVVIVDSPHNGYVTAVVVGDDESYLETHRLKWIVQRVVDDDYLKLKEQEEQAIKKMQELSRKTKRKQIIKAIGEELGLENADQNSLKLMLLDGNGEQHGS